MRRNKEPPHITLSGKKSDTKGPILYGSVYRKCSKQGTPQRGPEMGDCQRLGEGDMGTDYLMGVEILFEVMKMFSIR